MAMVRPSYAEVVRVEMPPLYFDDAVVMGLAVTTVWMAPCVAAAMAGPNSLMSPVTRPDTMPTPPVVMVKGLAALRVWAAATVAFVDDSRWLS